EAIKLITGIGEPLIGRLMLLDAAAMSFRTIQVRKDPECPACGTHEIKQLVDYDILCGTAAEEPETSGIAEIGAKELAARLQSGADVDLIDVREPFEWRMGHIPGARLVPLGKIPEELAKLDRSRETIFYCKMGARSRNAAEQAAAAGVRKVSNLKGGILSWMTEIDPTLPRY